METQIQQIQNHLISGKTITTYESFIFFGCTRLAAAIYILKQRGLCIEKEMIKKENGVRYAKYFLK